MEIVFEKKENASALMTITLAEADYQVDYQKKVKDYSKKVHMKGFRPGKVPADLVERMYGPALKSEVINQVLNRSMDQYIRENDVQVLGDFIADETAETQNFDAGKGLEFTFKLAIRPDVQYTSPESTELMLPEIEITEDRVNSFIEDMRKRHGSVVDGEMVAEGDLIKGELKALDGSFSDTTAFPLSRVKEGYVSAFLGKKVGETFEFPIEEAFEAEQIKYVTNTFKDKDKTFAGLFSLTITQISQQVPAALDQDFFDKAVGEDEVSDEAGFREKIREMFRSTYDAEALNYFEASLIRKLIGESTVTLDEEFIQQVIRRRLDGKHEEEAIANFLPVYIRDLKKNLIFGKIAEDNSMQITEAEILEAAKNKIASDFKQMGYGSFGDDFIERYAVQYLNEKDKNNRDQMVDRALSAKITQLYLEKGKIVRNSVSIEKFNQLVEELN